jgi:hypothetical protein
MLAEWAEDSIASESYAERSLRKRQEFISRGWPDCTLTMM